MLAGPRHEAGVRATQLLSKWYNPVTLTDHVPGVAVNELVMVSIEVKGPGVALAKVKDEADTVAVRPVEDPVGPATATETE